MTSAPENDSRAAPKRSELTTRAISAFVLILLVVTETLIGGWFFLQFLCVVSIIAFWEWNAMTIKGVARNPFSIAVRLFIALPPALILSLLAARLENPELYWLAIAAVVVIAAGLITMISPAGRNRKNIIWYLIGLPYVALPFVAIWALRDTPVSGIWTLFFVLVVVATTDTAAFFVGRKFKGPKLAPAISPGKTWSGALGGLAGALVVGGIWAYFSGGLHQFAFILLIVAGMSIGSQIGDLVESAVKRRSGVKDSGRLIPGHGGVLDRIDGLMFAVVIALAMQLLNTECAYVFAGSEPRLGLFCAQEIEMEVEA
jgi:phosphatidate cytidylyltransferase